MYRFLRRLALLDGKSIEIDGLDLLRVVQKHSNNFVVSADLCTGAGTAESPWRPKGVKEWFTLSRHISKNKKVQFFGIAGRLIRRDIEHDLYFSDVGPMYLQGADQPALRFNGGVAPTYRAGAQLTYDQRDIFPRNKAWAEKADFLIQAPLNWNNVAKQPIIVRGIRAILDGKPIPLGKEYSRMQTMLPVFLCAMFLAEPARNIRAFVINAMLLDLAERGRATLGNILWHPQALDVDRTQEGSENWSGLVAVEGIVEGPGVDRTTLASVTRRGDLHNVGGLMPASPTGGGQFAKGEAFVGKANKPKPVFAADFIHRKEVNVLIEWLAINQAGWVRELTHFDGAIEPAFAPVVHSESAPVSKKMFESRDAPQAAATLTLELKAIDSAIKSRLANFDAR